MRLPGTAAEPTKKLRGWQNHIVLQSISPKSSLGTLKTTLAKVSYRNLFQANQNYFDLFRYLYQSQSESFWTNSKNAFYLVWLKKRSKINPAQSDSIRGINPNPFFGLVRNDLHWLGYRYQNESEYFWLAQNESLLENFTRTGIEIYSDRLNLHLSKLSLTREK